MLPLQNQEPVLAHPCRHLGCPKKWFWRTSTESGTCHKSSKRFSLQNKGAQSFFFGAHLGFSETLQPLQNEEPTVSAMLPLQNQEPVLAHPCRHLGCPKKWLDGPLQNEEPATNLARGFLYKTGAPNPFFGALLWFSETLKPLQNEEPTVSAMLPLENQEPVIAYNRISLQALRLSKKMVLADPRGSW